MKNKTNSSSKFYKYHYILQALGIAWLYHYQPYSPHTHTQIKRHARLIIDSNSHPTPTRSTPNPPLLRLRTQQRLYVVCTYIYNVCARATVFEYKLSPPPPPLFFFFFFSFSSSFFPPLNNNNNSKSNTSPHLMQVSIQPVEVVASKSRAVVKNFCIGPKIANS